MSNEIEVLKADEKGKLEEAQNDLPAEQAQDRASRHSANSSWIGGVVLIGVGLIFLLSNLTGFQLDNWWALFILIPTFGAFGHAWTAYQEAGRLDEGARGSIVGGLFLLLITSTFLFDLDWRLIWPLFLILGGLAALTSGWFR